MTVPLSISYIFLNIKFDKKRKVCYVAQGGSLGGLNTFGIWYHVECSDLSDSTDFQ
ncbi:hypothetical protein MICAB_180003 [Microcystis aeruginosa PCC 9717]|uniref:Uncharacterized protein n=1 Tax=Microcystis aeruginosa PCC 9717 TaxID=1160286 RepID=I4FKU9_MICAE|nr:hypothetical protein MICAB_180003 [Microcystis aeruginosa PCC 9717]